MKQSSAKQKKSGQDTAAITSQSAGPGGMAIAPPNRTGLPDNLKSGIEALSGLSMDDVRVHYNSSKPTQLQALAYTQGTDIHVAPGQERHLPHEAWHVVQQKEGRVKPTMQMKDGLQVNDDSGLEQEADVMGTKVLQMNEASGAPLHKSSCTWVIQKYKIHSDSGLKVSQHENIVYEGKKKVYATQELVAASNKKLMMAGPDGSLIRLKPKEKLLNNYHQDKTYYTVMPELDQAALTKRMEHSPSSFHGPMGVQNENQLKLWADCRRASEAVTGSSSTTYTDDKIVTVRTEDGGQTKKRRYVGNGFNINKIKDITTNNKTGRLAWQIYLSNLTPFVSDKDGDVWDAIKFYDHFPHLKESKNLQVDFNELKEKSKTDIMITWSLFDSLKKEKQNAFLQYSGLNEYANPEVGEAYTIVTEYDMPNFVEGDNQWAFHWGGVVMKDGEDNITLENYSVGVETELNTKWMFEIYGTQTDDQTFHSLHMLTNLHGNKATTLAVTTEGTGDKKQDRLSARMTFYRNKIIKYQELERIVGVDFREEMLEAAVNFNMYADEAGKERISEYEILQSQDRKFTKKDKDSIHFVLKQFIPV